MSGVGRPECRGSHLGVGGQILAQSPCGLGQCQAQSFDVDVAVRQPLPDRLKAADRTVKLLTSTRVFSGQLQAPVQYPELKRAATQRSKRGNPGDRVVA